MSLVLFPAHGSVKDSGIPWVGAIPTHWNVENPKWMFFHRKARAKKGEQQLAATQKYGVIPQDHFMEKEGRRVTQVFLDFDILKHVERGDFVMSMRSFQGGLEFSDFTGCVSSAYVAIQPGDGVHSPFFKYLFKSSRYIEALQATSNLVRDGQALRFDNFTMVPLPVVPIVEQRAIAALLDEKCAKVDEAVRIKEEQITLLRERRQILIQQVVTCGLNPDAPMKDSGVDWIGQIPAHWEVKRAKFLFREVNERSNDGSEELLSVSHTTGVTSRSEKNISMFMAEDYAGAKLCRPGDTVFNTMWAWMGALGVSDVVGIVSPSYGVYRQLRADSFNNRYLEWLLRGNSYVEHYNRVSTGLHSSRLRFYAHMFLDMFLGFPPRAEQDEIVAFVDQAVAKIDAGIAIKEDQIATLKEYKNSLINAAVTGKIKVS